MNLIKSIVSICLIMAYSLGLANNSFVNCFDNCLDEDHIQVEHNHDHYELEEDFSESDHEHFEHDDHVDHGFLDFLTCLFSDLQHEHNAAENQVVETESRIINKIVQFNEKELTPFAFQSFVKTVEPNLDSNKTSQFDFLENYRSPELSASQLRGPPSLI